jgi:hypothetical protein
LRSDILEKEPAVAEWLFDLLAKLGQEDDAYHATCLILMDYAAEVVVPDTGEDESEVGVPEPGTESDDEEDRPAPAALSKVDRDIKELPMVNILTEKTPEDLDPGRFLAAMVKRVLGATPVNMHKDARQRRASPMQI